MLVEEIPGADFMSVRKSEDVGVETVTIPVRDWNKRLRVSVQSEKLGIMASRKMTHLGPHFIVNPKCITVESGITKVVM